MRVHQGKSSKRKAEFLVACMSFDRFIEKTDVGRKGAALMFSPPVCREAACLSGDVLCSSNLFRDRIELFYSCALSALWRS